MAGIEEKKIISAKEKLEIAEVDAALEAELGVDPMEGKSPAVKLAFNFARLAAVCLALYFFLCSLTLMGNGFTALSGTAAGSLFGAVEKPMVALMVGILATVLVQSSSTTTSIIVVLVGSSLVSVQNAIPMIMGANIGTSVTNTIVSMGFVNDKEAYRRGFSGATVHDMFNFLNVALLLPLELLVAAFNGGGGILQIIAHAITNSRGDDTTFEEGDDFKEANPVKKITEPLTDKILTVNKKVIEDHAQEFPEAFSGEGNCTETIAFSFRNGDIEVCDGGGDCVFCEPGTEFNAELFEQAKEAFDDAPMVDEGVLASLGDELGGIVCLLLSLVMLIVALLVIVKVLSAVMRGPAKKILVKTLNYDFVGGGYLAIFVGCAITILVQSSSITTSIFTPLVAADALSVDNMYPFTLGANIGTTATGLITASATGKRASFEIAIVHLFFNLIGTLIWYPIPLLRAVPVTAAKFLGEMASEWKPFPMAYLFTVFLVLPFIFFGISQGFSGDSAGGKAGGAIGLVIVLTGVSMIIYTWKFANGKDKFLRLVKARKEEFAGETKAIKAVGAPAEQLSV